MRVSGAEVWQAGGQEGFLRHVTCPLVPSLETGSPGRWAQLVTDLIICLSLPYPFPHCSFTALVLQPVGWQDAGCKVQGNRPTSLPIGLPCGTSSLVCSCSTLLQKEGLWSSKCRTRTYVPYPSAWPVMWANKLMLYLGKDSLGWSWEGQRQWMRKRREIKGLAKLYAG